jgi:hypothetical protein
MISQDDLAMDITNTHSKPGNKIIWWERVQSKTNYERRIAIEEAVTDGVVAYRIIIATCKAKSKDDPDWEPRSGWKSSYDETVAVAKQIFTWACRYANENGFASPMDTRDEQR